MGGNVGPAPAGGTVEPLEGITDPSAVIFVADCLGLKYAKVVHTEESSVTMTLGIPTVDASAIIKGRTRAKT